MSGRRTIREAREQMGTPAFVGILFFFGIIVAVSAILIGRSDSGQINVSATIQNSNQAIIDAGGSIEDTIGNIPENLRNMPNGGLVSSENQELQLPPPEVETGTSTEGRVSSTTGTTTQVIGDAPITNETEAVSEVADTSAQ